MTYREYHEKISVIFAKMIEETGEDAIKNMVKWHPQSDNNLIISKLNPNILSNNLIDQKISA